METTWKSKSKQRYDLMVVVYQIVNGVGPNGAMGQEICCVHNRKKTKE